MVNVSPNGVTPTPPSPPTHSFGDDNEEGVLSGINFESLEAPQATSQPQPGSVVPVQADTRTTPEPLKKGYKWNFEKSTYRNDDELRYGVDQKDRIIESTQAEIAERDRQIEEYRLALQQKAQEVEMVANLYGQQVPDEAAQIDLFAKALLSEEFQDKTDADFQVDMSKFTVDPAQYKVDPNDYDDDDDYKDAVENAQKRKHKRERDLETRLRDEQGRIATEYQRYIQERERARAQVIANLEQQKEAVKNTHLEKQRLLREAGDSLKAEITKEALGLRNAEHGIIAQEIFYKRPITVRLASGESAEKMLAEVVLQLRVDYGRPLTDLLIKGVRQEIHGDGPTAMSPDARPPARPGLRPPSQYSTHTNDPDAPLEAKEMFESAGWAG